MASPLHQPHDHLFRLVFADPEETAAFLRARLPGSHQRGILWPSLRRAAGSFIDQERIAPLLWELQREPVRGGVDHYQAFIHGVEYIVKTGPADTLEALGEVMRRVAPQLRGDLMACGEMLRREGRQEGELKGRREVRLETIDGLLRAGVKWPVILSATGIDEPTYRTLKRDASHVPEQAAPR